MAEPPVTIEAYHFTPGDNTPIDRLVIHTTSPPKLKYPAASAKGQANRTALYFTLASSKGSAHYVCDVAAEEHCLRDSQIAWHAPPNRRSIGIEVCGQAFYTRQQWLSPDVWPAVEWARIRARELAVRHKVPWVRLSPSDLRLKRRGLCGHVDVAKAFGQSDHTDPGPNFPWDKFMATPEVKPMFDPPIVLRPIAAEWFPPHGGHYQLGDDGSVYAWGASYHGGPNGKPYFVGRKPARIEQPSEQEAAAGKVYVVVATSGERYAYPE